MTKRYKVKAQRQYTVWYEETLQVEATSPEHAKEIVENGEFDDHLDTEVLFETEYPNNKYEPRIITDGKDIVWEKEL